MRAKWFRTVLIVLMLVVAIVPSAGTAQSGLAQDQIVVSNFGTISVSSAGASVGDNTVGPIVTEMQKPKRLDASPLRTAFFIAQIFSLSLNPKSCLDELD